MLRLRSKDWLLALATAGVLLGAGASVASGAFATAARAHKKTLSFPVQGACSSGEVCPAAAAKLATLRSASDLTVVYTAPAGHCSDVAVRLFVGRRLAATTPFVSPTASSSEVQVPWPKDGKAHALGFEGVGKVGGCNAGTLVSWAGTLKVTYVPRARKLK